jgi:Holliday junction resolvasome RuvABC DNA-binding subunit
VPRGGQQFIGQEAQDALVALGYKPLQAQQMISQLQQSGDVPEPNTTEQLVSMALRNAARRGTSP